MSNPSPKEIAEFDQAFTEASNLLSRVAANYLLCRHLDQREGLSAQQTITTMLAALNGLSHDELVSVLAAAIVALIGKEVGEIPTDD